MSIAQDVQAFAAGSLWEGYAVDLTAFGEGILRFHAGTNEFHGSVVWQGNTYIPLPVQIEGMELNGQGRLPRPKIRVANPLGVFSPLLKSYDDLIGCQVTVHRTLVRYLDATNFVAGNPDADSTAEFPLEIFNINQKTVENKQLVEFELAAATEMEGAMVPNRVVVGDTCPWDFRGDGCGYTGTLYFDVNDNPVTSATQDVCGHRIKSCTLRQGDTVPITFGGYPGAALVSNT